jgi:hypothetical protein
MIPKIRQGVYILDKQNKKTAAPGAHDTPVPQQLENMKKWPFQQTKFI